MELILALIVTLPCLHAKETILPAGRFGQIKGKVTNLQVPNAPRVKQFLGIPYTSAVMDGNASFSPARQGFLQPGPVPYDATRKKDACVQNFPDISNEGESLKSMPKDRLEYLKRLKKASSQHSQDCLHVNFYVPDVETDGSKLPVVMFIHGESYDWNSGNAYDPSVLAALGRLVVVTVNYRLGPFGFLSGGTGLLQGNQGLADIIAAIHQVATLAPFMGGDPKAITLMGAGTGAAIVQSFMTSPVGIFGGIKAGGSDTQTFKRAIMLSGSLFNKWAVQEHPTEYFYLFASNMGCDTYDKNRKAPEPPDKVLACIYSKKLIDYVSAQRKMPKPSFLPTFGPTIDGNLVINQRRLLDRSGANYRNFDLLIGLNAGEGRKHLSHAHLTDGISAFERERIFRTLVRNLFSYHRKEILDSILNRYTDWTLPRDNANYTSQVLEALTDGLYGAAMVKFAHMHAAQTGASNPSKTFMYVFQGKQNASSEDLAYIFGYPVAATEGALVEGPYPQQFTREDAAISRAMIRYVASFAEFGDPSSSSSPAQGLDAITERFDRISWPMYSSTESYLTVDKYPQISHHYRADFLAFWNDLLDKLDSPGPGTPDQFNSHHLLPGYTDKNRYFGDVYPVGGFVAGLPPPTPPAAPPAITATVEAIMEKRRKEKAILNGQVTEESPVAAKKVDSTMLSITVAIGCTFLILNVLVLAGIYHQRDKQKKERAKLKNSQACYNSYDAPGGTGMSPYINLNSPTGDGSVPPPPPPPGNAPGSSAHQSSTSFIAHPSALSGPPPVPARSTLPRHTAHATPMSAHATPGGGPHIVAATSTNTVFTDSSRMPLGITASSAAASAAATHNHYPGESEPLLRTSVGAGAGICPRHGKPVQPRPALSTTQSTAGMEEIQV